MTIGTNDFQNWAEGSPGTNLMDLPTFEASTARQNGVTVGLADETLYNRAARQSAAIAKLIGDFIADQGLNCLDDGNDAARVIALQEALGTFNYASDTGTPNAYVVSLSPVLTSHVVGMPIRVKFANANTGASTFNPGPGAAAITHDDGSALNQGDIVAGMIGELIYTGGSYVLQRNRFSTDAITASGTDLNSAVTPASLASVMLGSPGQTLNNYTTTKFAGTVYTNSTGRPILVMWLITVGPGQSFTLYLNGNIVGGEGNQGPSATNLGSMLVVPNGYTYELVFTGSSTSEWWEVR